MSESSKSLVSIVSPVYNEQSGISAFYNSLAKVLDKISGYNFEIVFCNDGSTDDSLVILKGVAKEDERVRLVTLSRNFGKEIAMTAGIEHAKGAAIITIDSDSQHPIEILGQFIEQWEKGYKVVVGKRKPGQHSSRFKRFSSSLFYKLFNKFSGTSLVQGATDYCLIDRSVQKEFMKLTERNRLTRGLIDWLGYEQKYIIFEAKKRVDDKPSYSYGSLFKLALDSIISLTNTPLYLIAYTGAVVLPLSFILGLIMIIDKLFGDPFHWHATGGAYILVLMLFLMGILLMSQGFIGLYLSHIHQETQNRPIYIVSKDDSVRL